MRHPAINHQPGRRETTDLAVIPPEPATPRRPPPGQPTSPRRPRSRPPGAGARPLTLVRAGDPGNPPEGLLPPGRGPRPTEGAAPGLAAARDRPCPRRVPDGGRLRGEASQT